jgi:hypothetical protein
VRPVTRSARRQAPPASLFPIFTMSNSSGRNTCLYPKQKVSRRRPPRLGFRLEDYVVFSEARYLENRNSLCNTFFASICSLFRLTESRCRCLRNHLVFSARERHCLISFPRVNVFRQKSSARRWRPSSFETWGRPFSAALCASPSDER